MSTWPTPSELSRYAVLLVNLGTPDEPTVPAVRRYLKQFLSDQRVVDYPKPLWQLILRGIILPFRGRRVAKLYQSIWWPEGSPLRVITQRQTTALANALLFSDTPVSVRYAMTYGQPAIAQMLMNCGRKAKIKSWCSPCTRNTAPRRRRRSPIN